jgi:uncharacterized membrane protein YcaP (DUF421 family)
MLETILLTVLVYGVFLLLFRLLGKRELGQFSPFDLIVLLILGEVSGYVLFGEVPVAEGLAVIAVIGSIEVLVTRIKLRSSRVSRWLEGSPREVVRDGRILDRALATEHLSRDDLLQLLRLHGKSERDIAGIESAVLEVSGELSVVEKATEKPIRKRDVPTGAWP